MTTIDTKVEDYFATGDSVRRIESDFPEAAERGMISGRTYTVRDHTVRHDGAISVQGVPGMWSATGFELVSRATDHQPAPEPEPEWKPGIVGTATIRGVEGVRGVWASLFDGELYFAIIEADKSGTGSLSSTAEHVTDFVPDEPSALPTRQELASTIAGMPGLLHDSLEHHYDINPFPAADRVLALLRGESR